MRGLVPAYRALAEVYQGAWIGEATRKQGGALTEEKGAFRLVYGVIEHEYLYEYRIARLAEKAPKSAVKLLLKMGMYLIDETSLPPYAAVSEIVECAKKVGKGGVVGFLNALLRRYAETGKEIYPTDPIEGLSVRANLPVWLVKRYIAELGEDKAKERLTLPRTERTHIRAAFSFGKEKLAALLKEREIAYEETEHGFYIGTVGKISDLLREGKATVMSFGSAEIASALPCDGDWVLDLCAAPGGKSVWLAEKYGAPVLACDKYEHRVELIRKYAERMGASSVTPVLHDGTVLCEDWVEAFPFVLVDAPCSGLGSLASNPDVPLHRKERDLDAITATQSVLLRVAGRYVRQGGYLLYATCSDLPSEDERIVRGFLSEQGDFSLEKERYTDPVRGGGESYYYALLRKQ